MPLVLQIQIYLNSFYPPSMSQFRQGLKCKPIGESITAFIEEEWAGDRDSPRTRTASGALTGKAGAWLEQRTPSGAE